MTWLYFNELDPFTAQWCRNAWPEAEVDDRSILDITSPVDAVRQHYFAGIGGWEYACELAGWPRNWPLWTGSCPCQPFSVAGKGQAAQDERDLWPAFFRLIALGTPPVIIGEQVNGAIAFGWLDRVCDDLEGIGYAVGAAVLPACSVGAPHIRQRLYWMAVAQHDGHDPTKSRPHRDEAQRALGLGNEHGQVIRSRDAGGLADTQGTNGRHRASVIASEARLGRRGPRGDSNTGGVADATQRGQRADGGAPRSAGYSELSGQAGGLGDSSESGWQGRERSFADGAAREEGRPTAQPSALSGRGMEYAELSSSPRQREHSGQKLPESNGCWAASELIYCRDGHWRRIPLEPGLQPLADSGRFGNPRVDRNLSSRIGALRAAGNAIVIPLAAEFIRAVMDIVLDSVRGD